MKRWAAIFFATIAAFVMGPMPMASATTYSSWQGWGSNDNCYYQGQSDDTRAHAYMTRWENGGNNDTIAFSDYPEVRDSDVKVVPTLAQPVEAKLKIERKDANGNYETVWGPYTDNDPGLQGFFRFAVPMSEEYSVQREPRFEIQVHYNNALGDGWCTMKLSWNHNWDNS